jgi:hypothetical protein
VDFAFPARGRGVVATCARDLFATAPLRGSGSVEQTCGLVELWVKVRPCRPFFFLY